MTGINTTGSVRALLRIFIYGTLLIISVGLAACGKKDGPNKGPQVTVATPIAKKITEWDEYTGRFEAVQSVEIRARVNGYLTSINFKEGQMVKEGDLLFVIDPRPYQAALDQAKAALERAQTQAQLAANSLDRTSRLLQSRAVSYEEYDQRLQQKKEADAAVLGNRAAVRSAELDLDYTQIRAPIAGRVSSKRIDVGNLITGGNGGSATLLTTIVSLNPIHFVFDASESEYLHYSRLSKSGQRASSRDVANPVYVRLADETDWTRRGQMDFVDNQINPRTGTIRGRAIFVNDDLFLTPGVFGRLRLLAAQEHPAILIPDDAILSDQARKVVAVVDGEKTVAFRPIVLGPIVDGLRVIREGLTVQDRIVIDGIQRVRPGAKVNAKDGAIQPQQASAQP